MEGDAGVMRPDSNRERRERERGKGTQDGVPGSLSVGGGRRQGLEGDLEITDRE